MNANPKDRQDLIAGIPEHQLAHFDAEQQSLIASSFTVARIKTPTLDAATHLRALILDGALAALDAAMEHRHDRRAGDGAPVQGTFVKRKARR